MITMVLIIKYITVLLFSIFLIPLIQTANAQNILDQISGAINNLISPGQQPPNSTSTQAGQQPPNSTSTQAGQQPPNSTSTQAGQQPPNSTSTQAGQQP